MKNIGKLKRTASLFVMAMIAAAVVWAGEIKVYGGGQYAGSIFGPGSGSMYFSSMAAANQFLTRVAR